MLRALFAWRGSYGALQTGNSINIQYLTLTHIGEHLGLIQCFNKLVHHKIFHAHEMHVSLYSIHNKRKECVTKMYKTCFRLRMNWLKCTSTEIVTEIMFKHHNDLAQDIT